MFFLKQVGLSPSYLSRSWGVVYRIPTVAVGVNHCVNRSEKYVLLKIIVPDRPEDTGKYQSYVRGLNPSASISRLPSEDPPTLGPLL